MRHPEHRLGVSTTRREPEPAQAQSPKENPDDQQPSHQRAARVQAHHPVTPGDNLTAIRASAPEAVRTHIGTETGLAVV